MDKQQILSLLTRQLELGVITREDLYAVATGTPSDREARLVPGESAATTTADHSRNLSRVLYGVGAIIALAGVVILVQQFWDVLGFAGRILVTLGIAFATYAGALLMRSPAQRVISQVLLTIAAVLGTGGAFVLLDEAGVAITAETNLAVSLALFIVFLAAWLLTKRNVLPVVLAMFATWAFYAALYSVLFGYGFVEETTLQWATLIVGISYIFVGSAFGLRKPSVVPEEAKEERSVRTFFYFFGAIAALGAGISFGGIGDLLFIALLFAAFYSSVYLKSRAMLVVSALFLIGFVFKLTGEYFADSLGWPVALVIAGFLTIGVGSGSLWLSKKISR